MAIVAAATAALAGYFYPWPEIKQNNAMVGKDLFDEYKSTQVRGIQILQFNQDKGILERIDLRRKGDKWIIPAKDNYVVSNGTRISALISSLQDKEVLEFRSDEQQDYLQYGVLDPSDFANVKKLSALGTKVILTDRQKKEIASLIIGLPFKSNEGNQQRFVRVPGQPNVYMVNYPAAVLATEFSRWVDPNPLQLKIRADAPGQQIERLSVDNYRIDFAKDKTAKTPLYRAAMQPLDGKLGVVLEVPTVGDPQKYQRLNSITPVQEAGLTGIISSGYLFNILPTDVAAKAPKVRGALKAGNVGVAEEILATMNSKGFNKSPTKPDAFESAGGSLSVLTPDAVRMDIYIGSPVAGGDGSRYVMIQSRVNQKKFPKPVRPEGVKEDEDTEANKAYRRLLQDWEQRIGAAKRAVDALNALHAPWYYVLDEKTISALRPDLPITPAVAPSSKPDPPAAAEGDASEEVEASGDGEESSESGEEESESGGG